MIPGEATVSSATLVRVLSYESASATTSHAWKHKLVPSSTSISMASLALRGEVMTTRILSYMRQQDTWPPLRIVSASALQLCLVTSWRFRGNTATSWVATKSQNGPLHSKDVRT